MGTTDSDSGDAGLASERAIYDDRLLRLPFGDAQSRTLQGRVEDWRGVTAKRLVYAASDEYAVEHGGRGESALVEQDPAARISVIFFGEDTCRKK